MKKEIVYNGFILLSRNLLDSSIFASQKLLKIWIWCLMKASYKDRHVSIKIGKGESIVNLKRGEFIFGRFIAEDELCIDGSTIYKSIQKLQEMEMININSNNHYSVISICNYDTYQNLDNYKVTTKEQASNNELPTNGQPSNTYNNDNNDKKVKEIIYSNFYDFEIEYSNKNDKYTQLVKFLYGNNATGSKLENVLSLNKQLSFEQFKNLIITVNETKIKLTDILLEMENWKDIKKKTSVYLTANNWMKRHGKNS